MFGLEIDMSEVQRVVRSLRGSVDQIPYAMMLALNDATEKTRQHLIKTTWPSSGIKVRNASFIAASLTSRDYRATKTVLSTEIYDRLRRGHLAEHAKGGVRVAKGRNLAVPSRNVPRTARGVPKGLRPNVLGTKLFPVKGGRKDLLYTRDRRGRLKLMYVLKSNTRIPRRVPFYEDYEASMRLELRAALPLAVARAMATRRR